MSLYIEWIDGALDQRRLYFDCATTLGVEQSLSITDNPVESGANVTDHARKVPDVITVSVFVSNAPIDDLPDRSRAASAGSVSLSVPRYVIEGRTRVGFGKPLGRRTVTEISNSVLVMRSGNFIQETYDLLSELQDSAELLTIATGYKRFTPVLLQHIKPSENADTGDGMEFALTFKTIRIVESQIVKIPKVPQAKKVVTKGKQDPSESSKAAQKTTVARGLQDLLPTSFTDGLKALFGGG